MLRHALLLAFVLACAVAAAAAQYLQGVEAATWGRCFEFEPSTPGVIAEFDPVKIRNCNGARAQDFIMHVFDGDGFLALHVQLRGTNMCAGFRNANLLPDVVLRTCTPGVLISTQEVTRAFFTNVVDLLDKGGKSLLLVYLGGVGTGYDGETARLVPQTSGALPLQWGRWGGLANDNAVFREFLPIMLEFSLTAGQGKSLCIGSTGSGAVPMHNDPVVLRACNPGDPRVLFTYDSTTQNLKAFGTDLCLRDLAAGMQGVQMRLWTCLAGFTSMRLPVPNSIMQVTEILSIYSPNTNGITTYGNSTPGLITSYNGYGMTVDGATPQLGDPVVTRTPSPSNRPNQLLRRWVCRAVPGFDWDVSDSCASCLSDNKDPATGCSECLLGLDAGTSCLTCAAGFDSTVDCALCDGAPQDCFETGRAALEFAVAVTGAAQTSARACQAACARAPRCVNFAWRRSGSTRVCEHSEGSVMSVVAVGNGVDEAVFGPKYCATGPGMSELGSCQTCHNDNWDLDTGCSSCHYGWNASKDCLQCDNPNIDPTSNCTTCNYINFNINDGCQGTCTNANLEPNSGEQGCGFCKNGFDEATTCTTCRNDWDLATGCTTCASGLDEFSDCTEEQCVCGAGIGNCTLDGTTTTGIWEETVALGRFPYNDTNFTAGACAAGVTPEDIYRHMSCVGGSSVDVFEGVRRAFVCSAQWLRARPDLSDLTRADSYIYDGIISKTAALASDEALDVDVRMKAAQLAATWQVVRQQGRGATFEYRYAGQRDAAPFTTAFPAPPALLPFGSDRIGVDRNEQLRLSLVSYLDLFSAGKLVDACKDWFRGFGQCECGLRYESNNCVSVPSTALANLYGAHMFCALADGIIGTGASVELLQRTTQCVKREVWKAHDHGTIAGLLEMARATARLSSASALAATNGVRETLADVQADLSRLIQDVSRDASLMEAHGGQTFARIVAAESSQELSSTTVDAVGRQIILQSIDESTDMIGAYLGTVAGEISAQMEANFMQTTRTLEGLGDLILSATNLSIATTKAGLTALASAQRAEVSGELDDIIKEQSNLQVKFRSRQTAVYFDANRMSQQLATLEPYASTIGVATEDFYKCKRDQELAALARARARAIFDVVVGAVQIVAEAALMVGTGGGYAGLKAAAQAGTRALVTHLGARWGAAVAQSAVTEVYWGLQRNLFEAGQDGVYGPDPIDPTARGDDAADALGSIFGATYEDQFGSIKNGVIPDLDGNPEHDLPIETAAGVFDVMGSVGVPFADGISQILVGAKVLADYNGAKEEVREEYRANLEKSRVALEKLGEMAAEFGEFSAKMMAEFGELLQLRMPYTSVIESTSGSFWRATQLDIIEFAKQTDMYQDFLKVARRRALTEAPWGEHRLLLEDLKRFDPQAVVGGADDNINDGDAGGALRGQLEARARGSGGAAGGVATTEMRRALDSKKEDCNLGDKARTGLRAFNSYFKEFDLVIFYAESLHENLVDFMSMTRELISMRQRIKTLEQLLITYDSAIADINAPTSDLDTFGAAFQQVLQRSYQRAAPEITSFKPEAFKRTALLQDDFLWEVCNAARYRFLETPASCDFRVADVVQSAKPTSVAVQSLSDRLDALLDELGDLDRDFGPVTEWVRLPVASTLGIRSAIAVDSAVTDDSVFSFSFAAPPPAMAGADCGYNHEMEAFAFVLESRDSGAAGLHPPALEREWYTYKLDMAGPFVKLDAAGNRHVFAPEAKPNDFGTRRARVLPAADSDCGEPTFSTETFVIREDQHRVCTSKQNADSFGVSPVTPWGTTFNLTLRDLALLVADEDLDLELVMYAKLRGVDALPSCEALQFNARQVTDDSGAGDAAVIVGVSLGAVAFAAAGAFAAKKYLATRAMQATTGKVATATALPEL